MSGVAAASLAENWSYVLYDVFQYRDVNNAIDEIFSKAISFVTAVRYGRNHACLCSNRSSGGIASLLSNRVESPDKTTSVIHRILRQLWRYSPDILAICCGVLSSVTGRLDDKPSGQILYMIGVPSIILMYLLVVFTQRGADRENFSRYFLESVPMNIMGYTSYAICKITRINCLVLPLIINIW